MHLVDDEHLVAVTHRLNRQTRDDHFPNVLDLGVRGGVYLEHVDVAPVGDLTARVAVAARVGGRARDAVQRARENTCGGRLAHPTWPRKHERLRQPVMLDGIA